MDLSRRVQSIKPSPTLAITAKAKELKAAGRDVVGLGAGEPDFDTPDHIKEAAIEAIRAGFTKYTPVGGIPELKEAIRRKFQRENGLEFQTAQILVTVGGKQAFYNLAQAAINPGDEVIIPAPYWVSYPDMVLLADGVPMIVDTDEDNGFKMRPDSLEAAITPRTRFVVLNSPSNPTGSVYDRQELAALGEVLRRHPQVGIISDDIYEHILFDGQPFVTFAQVAPDLAERTITLNGVSKAYAMTGWRIGYAAGPKSLIKAMENIQSQSTSNACSIAQKAAVAALDGPQACMAPMQAAFTERRDYVWRTFNAIPGISCLKPAGAFYAYPNVGGLLGHATRDGAPLRDSTDLAAFLLDKYDVSLVPGTAFGKDPFVRISFATSMKVLEKAMERIRRASDELLG